MTTIIVTMAGRGQRFRDVGYDLPKYAIEVHGQTLFRWSLQSLASWLAEDPQLVLVSRAEDGARPFVEEQCRVEGLRAPVVVELDHTTDGQATTVLAAADVVEDLGAPLVVYNIDTHVRPGAMDSSRARGDGWIPCFPGLGDAWSFCAADAAGRVHDVKEKVRISQDASVGLYWFSSFSLYEQTYARRYGGGSELEAGERYIAPMYRTLLDEGRGVYLDRLSYDDVVPLGTPQDVQAFADSSKPAGRTN